MKKFLLVIFTFFSLSIFSQVKDLTGAGATFPTILYTKWFSEYYKLTSLQVNYQSIGSGGGIKSISDMTVDFGATDGFMTDEQLSQAKGGKILHIPMALGSVVPTYNVSKDILKFTPETLAGIFLGDITKWNDPLLVKDNPSLSNVDKYIVVIHRSDGSGTTNIFTSYLTSVSDKWAKTVGAANSVQWPLGLGGKGNEGVAGNVKQTPFSIGYVEEAYARQNNLSVGLVKNSSGVFIEATTLSTSSAASNVTLPDDLRIKLVNSSNPKAFPIVGFTWVLVYQNQKDSLKSQALIKLLNWCIHEGQAFNTNLDYSPLPSDVVKKAEFLLSTVK
jgi:phosphate transport system substrate-binding protein